MVKTRAETTNMKRKKDTITSSYVKESLEVGSDGNSRRNSFRATRSRSLKRDSKSVEEPSLDLKKGSENQPDSREMQIQGPSKTPRKRNASLGQGESPSKKVKVESGNSRQNSAKKATKNTSVTKEVLEDKLPEKIPSKEQEGTSLKHIGKRRSSGKLRPTQANSQSPRTKGNIKPACTPSPVKKRSFIGKKLKLNSTCHDSMEGKSTLLQEEEKTSSSDESSESEGVAWQDVDEADVDHELDDQDKKCSGASTSKQHGSPSKKNVEISISLPGAKNKQKGCQEDVMKLIKRAINRFKKEINMAVHKVHLLALVSHGFFRNRICNNPLLQAVVLSHVPKNFVMSNKRKWDVAQLTNFLKWFQSKFSNVEVFKTGDTETDKQVTRIQHLSEVFVIVLRAQGFLTRLVCSLQPLSAKGESERKTSPKLAKGKSSQGSRTAVNSKLVLDTTKKSETAKEQEDLMQRSLDKTANKPNKETFDHETGKKGKESREGSSQGSTKTNDKKRKGLKNIDEKEEHKNNNSKRKTVKKRPLRKRKKVDYSLSGSDIENDGDEEWDKKSSDSEESEREEENSQSETKLKKKNKTPLVRKGKSQASYNGGCSVQNESSNLSFVDLMDSDSDFEVTSKPLMKRKILGKGSGGQRNNKILSDDSDETVKCAGIKTFVEKGADWWSEVYLPIDKKWICIHLESSSVNHPELCEKYATQPLVYVVSFDNDNAAKDVTKRYASCWMSKTRKLRIDSDWWEKSLLPYHMKSRKLDKMENSQLEGELLEKPLPSSITEYKNHPLYVLKRHLLKFEAIYPESAAILGYCRGEAVFSRDCVHLLHTREKWLNEALVVKKGEKAYKVVKGRPKKNQPIHERDSVTIDLFGRWQTEEYKPPPAKDGKVPRNEYGNVELFKECMLPPGTKHIKISGIQRLAKKLGIDCAQAVVGFDFHCGFSHPVMDGVVVCEEYERVLLDAWREEEEEIERKKVEKREKRILANWKLFTRSLLIKERLKKRYNNQESQMEDNSSKDEEDDVVASTSVSWPLNRQEGRGSMAINGHCHVFLESSHRQDPVSGEWSKSCSCGLTLPFEKM